jgi:hypothetical protein
MMIAKLEPFGINLDVILGEKELEKETAGYTWHPIS